MKIQKRTLLEIVKSFEGFMLSIDLEDPEDAIIELKDLHEHTRQAIREMQERAE